MHTLPARPSGLGIHVQDEGDKDEQESHKRKEKQKETVRWVLDTPRRLQEMIASGKDEEAEKEWGEVSAILSNWGNVAGVKELRRECEAIMQEESGSESGGEK